MKNLIIVGLTLFLWQSAVCQELGFMFSPYWEPVKFSKRNIPAMLTTESKDFLRKNGYVFIGYFDDIEKIETYWASGPYRLPPDCPEFEISNEPTKEIARKAASYGGDLIILMYEGQDMEAVTKKGNCARGEYRRDYVPYNYYDDNNYLQTGYKLEIHYWCFEWEIIKGNMCQLIRRGEIYRKHDSEITGLLQMEENIDNMLESREGDKPKDDSEYKEYISKFEGSWKYHAIKRWYDYNHHLWDINSDLVGKDTTEGGLKAFKVDDGKLYGYKDNNGNIVIETRFLYADVFSDGLACVRTSDGYNDVYGYIDKIGNWIIAPTLDYARKFISGVAQVTLKGGKNGYIDKTGKIYMVDETREPAKMPKTIIIEKIMKIYKEISQSEFEFYKTVANLEENKKYDAMEKRFIRYYEMYGGNAPRWDDTLIVTWAKKDNNGKYIIVTEKKDREGCYCGYYNKNENIAIEPQFIDCKEFSDSLAAVCIVEGKSKKWGYIDRYNNWIIQPTYEWAGNFFGGVAGVRINGKQMYIDKTGKLYRK